MIMDKELQLASEQAVTASAASTNYIDLGSARNIGMSEPLYFVITCTEAATAAGAATVTFSIEKDDNSSFSSAEAVYSSGAIGKAALIAGYQLHIPVPLDLDQQYVRAYFTVATGPLTAGKFTVDITQGLQKNDHYPDAL